MKAGGQLKVFAVRALARCNGHPLPETTLVDAARLAFPHLVTPEAAVNGALTGLEVSGYVVSGTQDLTEETLWGLTDKGRLYAAQLR